MQVVEIISLKKSGRKKVVLDDGTHFPLYSKEIVRYGLKEGVELSEEQLDTIYTETVIKRAEKRLLYLLQRQERTESQLRDKLYGDGYPDAVIDTAIAYVKSYHYVDDLRYACTYIRYHQEQKSRYILEQELRKRGVPKDLIKEAFQEEYEADEDALIRKLLEKRHFDPETADSAEKRRTYAYLARRGFPPDKIRRGMRD